MPITAIALTPFIHNHVQGIKGKPVTDLSEATLRDLEKAGLVVLKDDVDQEGNSDTTQQPAPAPKSKSQRAIASDQQSE